MKTITFNNRQYHIHDRLQQFNVNTIPSTSVEFFGSNPKTGSLFVQFKNGGTYIFNNITPQVRKEMHEAKSIGSYIGKNIVGKFPSEKLTGKGLYS